MSNEQKLKELTINQMHSIAEYQRKEAEYEKRIKSLQATVAELEEKINNARKYLSGNLNVYSPVYVWNAATALTPPKGDDHE